jgi:predicted transcriptional regulator of viral defense system
MGGVGALACLAEVGEAQVGMVTTRQAELRGVHRRDLARLVDAGALERVAYGVYRVTGAPRASVVELRAAFLQLAPGVDLDRRTIVDGVVSHVSACLVHQIGLLESFRHEFSVPVSRRMRSRRDDVVIHRAQLAPSDVEWVDQMLVTNPTRTVSDLGGAGVDGDHLAGVVADVLASRVAKRRDIAAALAPHAERYGAPAGDGRRLLDDLLAVASDAYA